MRRWFSSSHNIFKMSAEDKKWNRLAEHMSYFHEHFKSEFNTLYELADGSFSKRMSLNRFLFQAKQFDQHLSAHHSIEEQHIFPILAKKMPKFSATGSAEHVKSHREIHEGLDELKKLIAKYSEDPTSYSPDEMRGCLGGFREALFHHLDEEVEDLGGENMRKFFTFEEFKRLPM